MNNSLLANTTLRLVYILAGLCVVFFLFSMYHRAITTDDAWFAEQAYWFAHDGYVHSDLFEGFPIFANQILVYHKLHIWQGAAVYKLFGWNVNYFKAISFTYLIIFLALLYYFLKYLTPVESRKDVFVVFLFLFFVNHLVFQQGFEFRPEIMMMCTGFLSYIFIFHAQQREDWRFATLAGMMAGITALVHLNGLIFIMAGGLLLVIHKNYRLAVWFGLGSVIGFLPYFYQLTSLEQFRHYLYALKHDPAVSEDDRNVTGMLKKLVFEYHRFTHHSYEFTYLILFIITITSNWKQISQNQQHKNLLWYLLFLTIFMALITTGSKTSYLLYSMPYVLLIMAVYFRHILNIKKVAPVFLTVLLVYTLANLDRDRGVFIDRHYDSPAVYAKIVNKYHIQPGTPVFAPVTFIFNEIGKLKIQSYLAYLLKYHNNLEQITVRNIFSDIYRRKKAFAILNPTMLKDMKFSPRMGETYYGYTYLGQEADLYIFRRNSDSNDKT